MLLVLPLSLLLEKRPSLLFLLVVVGVAWSSTSADSVSAVGVGRSLIPASTAAGTALPSADSVSAVVVNGISAVASTIGSKVSASAVSLMLIGSAFYLRC